MEAVAKSEDMIAKIHGCNDKIARRIEQIEKEIEEEKESDMKELSNPKMTLKFPGFCVLQQGWKGLYPPQ